MAFGLCPLLTQAGVELLLGFGTEEQKERYLAKLVSGEWTGSMCLTEPHAGSDVGALKTRAEREGDHYRIRGTKIFITFGEHDYTDNIIHMVLARLPDAPPGTRGISLFLVPKFLVNDDGSLGARNDLRCVSLEHKLGIHASPTCVMSFGDDEGAIGYLVGEEQGGMARDVHDDELRPRAGRARGPGDRRARLSGCARLRARARPGLAPGWRGGAARRGSSSIPTCAGR